jgi:hypothetical protein
LVFFTNFLQLSFNSFLQRVFFVIIIQIDDLSFLDFWLRIAFLSSIGCSSWIHIWWSIHIFESNGLKNRFDASNFRRNLFTFLLHFLYHFEYLDLELFLLWRITKEEWSFLRQCSILLALVIIRLQHVLLHGVHHKLVEHFWEIWLLTRSRYSSKLSVVVGHVLTLICFKCTFLYVVWSLSTHYITVNLLIV